MCEKLQKMYIEKQKIEIPFKSLCVRWKQMFNAPSTKEKTVSLH